MGGALRGWMGTFFIFILSRSRIFWPFLDERVLYFALCSSGAAVGMSIDNGLLVPKPT